ncbi:MAG: hypothetical protein PVH84_05320 [Candidatus Aminicenantes bacterium]
MTILTHNAFEDKLSLVLVPLLASAGLRILKFVQYDKCSRALLDALLSIPGIALPSRPEDAEKILLRTNGVYAAFPKSAVLYDSAPSDSTSVKIDRFKKSCLFTLYAAEWDGIACDIRIGDYSSAIPIKVAQEVAMNLKKHCDAACMGASFFITNMIQTLGYALGPRLELKEALFVLEARGPLDFTKLAIELGADLLMQAGKFTDRTRAKSFLKKQLQTGAALNKFKDIILMMNGDLGPIADLPLPALSQKCVRIASPGKGFVQRIAMDRLLNLKHRLCAGHKRTGILLLKKIGDSTSVNDTLAEAFVPSSWDDQIILNEFRDIFSISHSPPEFQPLVVEKIKGSFRF